MRPRAAKFGRWQDYMYHFAVREEDVDGQRVCRLVIYEEYRG